MGINEINILKSVCGFMFLLICCSPQQSSFNKDDWNFKEDGLYQKRKYLINDLVENHLQKGMQFREVEKLLGVEYLTKMEEYADTTLYMVYEIEVDYSGIDPHKRIQLKINYSNDSLVDKFELYKWDKWGHLLWKRKKY